jgi:hypothetical protein
MTPENVKIHAARPALKKSAKRGWKWATQLSAEAVNCGTFERALDSDLRLNLTGASL